MTGYVEDDESADLDVFLHRSVRNVDDFEPACHRPSPSGRMRCLLPKHHLLGSFDQHVGFARDGDAAIMATVIHMLDPEHDGESLDTVRTLCERGVNPASGLPPILDRECLIHERPDEVNCQACIEWLRA